MSSFSLQRNTELQSFEQNYGDDPLADRATDLYRREFVMGFVEKWDELIDWDARTKSEGQFFVDVLRAHGKDSVLDAATGTGFHSVRLTQAGFDVTSVDGSAAMLAKAFENGQQRGFILKTVQADWRELNRSIRGKYDAIICLGNSFTHLHDEQDRRKAPAEFYAALRYDGILILDREITTRCSITASCRSIGTTTAAIGSRRSRSTSTTGWHASNTPSQTGASPH